VIFFQFVKNRANFIRLLNEILLPYRDCSSETNFIDLTEIKSKFQSDVLVEVPSSRTIGNLITKLFHGVKIKPGRRKDNPVKYPTIILFEVFEITKKIRW
jgi:hypothetical protein